MMETKARYALIGSFTLAVILAAIGFILWLDRPGGLSQRTAYRIRFEQPVSGLQTGAAVQFDGIKVGEVTALAVDPQDPRRIIVAIAVDLGTPVRMDTKAGIDSQGLMGTSVITLEGGSKHAPALVSEGPEGPTLVADVAASRSLTKSAKDALDKVDHLIGDNSDSMKIIIDNLKTFSVALARNSGRLDSVMAGLERMAGGPPKSPSRYYDLTLARTAPTEGAKTAPQIAIVEPSALGQLQSQKMLSRTANGELIRSEDAEWTDLLPKMVQQKLLEACGSAGLPAVLADPMSQAAPQRQLKTEIRHFEISTAGQATAVVTIAATVVSPEGRILESKVFSASVASASTDIPTTIGALNSALGKVTGELMDWLSGVA